jgi:hypothetical protein
MFATSTHRFLHPTDLLSQMASDMLMQTQFDAVTDLQTGQQSNIIPGPGRELRHGAQEAGFREMIDEGVSSVSKSYLPL